MNQQIVKNGFLILLVIFLFLSHGCLENKVSLNYNPLKTPHERTPIIELEPHLMETVIKGEKVMMDKNLGSNGLSCASCHPNPELNRVWASVFPRRWATTMNPDHRIITLAQHNFGAYKGMMKGNLSAEDRSFVDLNVYLGWLGDGTVIWEREIPGQFQLIKSISNGRDLFYGKGLIDIRESCASCHSEASLEGIASIFPKYNHAYSEVVILDNFLKIHAMEKQGWNLELQSQELADLSAFLTNMSRGYTISLETG